MEASGEGEHFIEFEKYYDDTPPWQSATWDPEILAAHNERLASTALGDSMEYVVVDGKNAIKYKGPQAAAYLKINQDSKKRYAEFRETEVYKQMRRDVETYEAKIRGGLFTVPDFCSHLFNLEEREKFKNALNVPKICDLFTAAELEMMDKFRMNFDLVRSMEFQRMQDDFQQEAAHRLRQTNFYKQLNLAALTDEELARLNQVQLIPWLKIPTKNDLFTVDELNGEYRLPPSFECLRIDNPNREADKEKYVRHYQEAVRRHREWSNRKTKEKPTENDLFTVEELNGEYRLPPPIDLIRIDNPNREADKEKYVRYRQEAARREREWYDRKTKAVDEKSAPALTTKA